jgi:hypothetical protein
VRVARTLRLPSHAHPRNPFLAAASFATLAPPDTPVSYLLPLHTVFSCSPGRLCPIDFIDKGCSLAAARAGRGSGRRRRAWQAAARRVRCFSHAASLSPRARRSPPPYLFLGLDHLQKKTARIASHLTRILRLDRKEPPFASLASAALAPIGARLPTRQPLATDRLAPPDTVRRWVPSRPVSLLNLPC